MRKKISVKKCSICDEEKQREKKTLPDGKTIYVIPNTMIEWGTKVPIGDKSFVAGHVCPDCVVLKDLMDDPIPLLVRMCVECSKELTPDRYFKCYACQPELPIVDEDWIFEDTDDSDIDEQFFEALDDGIASDIMSARRKANGYGKNGYGNNNYLFKNQSPKPRRDDSDPESFD
jgi:hypothetical protein